MKYNGPRFVVGIDPGKKTGIAVYDTHKDTIETWEFDFTEEELARVEDRVLELLADGDAALSIERFDITPTTHKNSYAPWSLEVTGWLRRMSLRWRVPFIVQARAAGKNFSTDHRLRQLGWYVRGKGHANDACRYVLLFLVQRGWWNSRLGTMDD